MIEPSENAPKNYHTVSDLATFFNVSLDQARKLVRDNKEVLKPYKIANEYRFELDAFDNLKSHLIEKEINKNG